MPDLTTLIQTAWPELELLNEIGQGFGSHVYSVRQRDGAPNAQCAVKAISIPSEWSRLEDLQALKFSNEEIEKYLQAHANSQLQEMANMVKLSGCKNIVHITDYKILHPQQLQFVVLLRMELLTPLIRMAASGLDSKEIIRIGLELCDALNYCHERKIVHRDIKPSNIFLDAEGTCKLGDFGASKEFLVGEHTLTSVGTPQFMAPEAFRGSTHPDAFDSAVRTDIYSLGLVLYWLLNGCVLPFFPSDRIATYEEARAAFDRRMSGETLPAPAASPDEALLKVIRKATDYAPEKRYASAAEMKAALLAAGGQEPDAVKARRKKRRLLTAGLCALLIAFMCIAGWLFFRPEPLPKNLNLPLHVDKDYINVIILYPDQLTDRRSLALSQAHFDSAIEENWERWGVRDDTDVRNDLQRILNKDFCAMQADVKVELVAYFPIEGEDYSGFTDTFTRLGMPLFAFSSTDDEVIYKEWMALMEFVTR